VLRPTLTMHTQGKLIPQHSSWTRRLLSLSSIAVVAIILTACQTARSTLIVPPLNPVYATATEIPPTATMPAIATIVIPTNTPFYPSELPSPEPSPTFLPTGTPATILFTDPTQEPVPVASWRPPLYPDPWAPSLFDHFYFASPIAANQANTLVSDYRYGGVAFEDVVHTGVDIPAPRGTPIQAAGPGIVILAGYGEFQGGYDPKDPYGLAVTIKHDFGYQNRPLYTIYGHMSEVNVVVGQHVETGDLLGLVGETGRVTGPHLHFEVRIDDNSFFTTRNPELWLVPPLGWGIIAGRMMDTVNQPIYDQQLIITDPVHEQNWLAWSYGKTTVNSDPYYQENLVIGDLPEGKYLLRTAFGGMNFSVPIEVHAGLVSYFTFQGYSGFSLGPPPMPGAEFTPAPIGAAIP
jgi:murein DD-endopeptidase MepM/ murein hydrolase activator NlpD